jgi:hypothetical protein
MEKNLDRRKYNTTSIPCAFSVKAHRKCVLLYIFIINYVLMKNILEIMYAFKLKKKVNMQTEQFRISGF